MIRPLQQENNYDTLSEKPKTIILPKREFGTDLTSQSIQIPKKFENDTKDPLQLCEYTSEIYKFLHNTEEKYMPNANYLSFQEEINEKMRSILLNWLVDVHFQFNLLEETLFLTINIIDRYLERMRINKSDLQLIGVVSLFIACKYEET